METEHLIHVANRIEHNEKFTGKADELLLRWQSEPLMDGLFETPQSHHYHAEGPTVRHHLRLILTSLYAILEGEVRLTAIEEFVRIKGLEAEILEMENTIKEHAATLEVFALLHDIGKQFCLSVDDQDEIHYHGHEKYIWQKDAQNILQKMAAEFRLSVSESERVAQIISSHMLLLKLFDHGHDPKEIKTIYALAQKYSEDADDFFDLLQAAALLDQVFGSRAMIDDKKTIIYHHLINSFIAESEFAPWKREKQEKEALEARRRAQNKVFQAVGLDGGAVMRLLDLPPSRDLGVLLKKFQSAAKGDEAIDQAWDNEVRRRIMEAKKKLSEL